MALLPVGLRSLLPALRNDRFGVTAIEYALIAAFISILIVAAITLVGTSVSTFFATVGNAM
ncbi:MAG TPA: Flp family type IVb pilin [Stellaceae bacterium]|jgi:pilus assembly protein Flp/PilA|nr:Flp family type IVb pilin [Stellaceae bacterium]